MPSVVTTCPGCERTASWKRPFQTIRRPVRRTSVVSINTITGADGGNSLVMISSNKSRLKRSGDQAARLSTR
jgi:hypothetical protein